MLKKCLKHEWKACWKNMALLNGAAIFMGALGGSGFLFSQISELPDLLIVLYLFAYVLNALSVLASFAFLLLPYAIRYFTANTLLFYNKAMTFSNFLSYLWAQITCVADAAFSLIGITNHIGMALFSIVGFFASLFFGILLFYAAISIGSLVSSHKILTAVLSYIGMTTVIQIFGGISIVRVFQDSTPTAVVTTSSVSTLIITVVLCVVLFLICRYILSRRLNLS